MAIDRQPELVLKSLHRAGAIPRSASVTWGSPLRADGFKECRDGSAISKAGISRLPVRPLSEFWPRRGPVWDAVGQASDGTSVFVEAKAHIPEAASPPTRASQQSRTVIDRALAEARQWYAPGAKAEWAGIFYQYANRLAHHYFLRKVNGIQTVLVFLYFLNDEKMQGPSSVAEWNGASRLIHAALGVPVELTIRGVFDAFVDVRDIRT